MEKLHSFTVRAALQDAGWDRYLDGTCGVRQAYWFQLDGLPSSWVFETHGGPDGSLVVGDSHLRAGEWEDALWQLAPPGCESILVASCYPGSYTPKDSRIGRIGGSSHFGVVRVRYSHAERDSAVMQLTVEPDNGED